MSGFFVQHTSPFPKHSIISTCSGPQPAGNVAAGEHCSCQCPFMVFRAWQTRVSSHCARRKCRENSLPGWSDSLIHSALLDLRLTVQLLPINVKTRRKREGTRRRGRRRPPPPPSWVWKKLLLLRHKVGQQKVLSVTEQSSRKSAGSRA